MAAAVPPQQQPQAQPDAPAAVPPAAVPTQAVAVAPQPTPTPVQTPATSAAAPVATTEQQLAALNAPRSGRVGSSAFIVKETPAAASATAAPAAAPATVASVAPASPATAAALPETRPAVPVFPANTPYATARLSLQALGYGPASLPDAGKCDSNTNSTCFPERAACAKTDSVQCDFLWRRGDQLIRVRTVAIPPAVSAVECQVNCK